MYNTAMQYLRQVNKGIVCPASLKKPFLRQLKADVQDYCDENPKADIAIISAHFGTPTDVAEEFLSELSAQAVDRCTRRQKRVLWLTAAVILAAILTMVVQIVRDYQLEQNLLGDDFLATITYAEDSGAGQESIIKNPASSKE